MSETSIDDKSPASYEKLTSRVHRECQEACRCYDDHYRQRMGYIPSVPRRLETAQMLMIATPAGLEGFFAEAFYPAADVADIPLISEALVGRLMMAAPKYGLQLLPPA